MAPEYVISLVAPLNGSFDLVRWTQLRTMSLPRSPSSAPSTTSRSWLACTLPRACTRVPRLARVELYLATLTSTVGSSECRARDIHIHPSTRPFRTDLQVLIIIITPFRLQEARHPLLPIGTRLGRCQARLRSPAAFATASRSQTQGRFLDWPR